MFQGLNKYLNSVLKGVRRKFYVVSIGVTLWQDYILINMTKEGGRSESLCLKF